MLGCVEAPARTGWTWTKEHCVPRWLAMDTRGSGSQRAQAFLRNCVPPIEGVPAMSSRWHCELNESGGKSGGGQFLTHRVFPRKVAVGMGDGLAAGD